MRNLTRLATALTLSALTLAVPGLGAATAATAASPPGRGDGCARPGVVFCEDFDRLPAGPAASRHWDVDTRNGTLTVERGPGRGHRDQVLHVHTVDNGQAFLRVSGLRAPATGFYGRMRLRVAAFPTAPDWAHFTLVEATGPGSSEIVRPVGGQYVPTVGTSLWGIGADGGPTGDWTAWTPSAPATAGRWQCVQWRFDPSTGGVTTWFDGVDNPDLSVSATRHGGNDVPFVLPRVDTVKIGWQLYQSGTTPAAFDLWIDDVALATHRLAC
jgi:hypothetical protein